MMMTLTNSETPSSPTKGNNMVTLSPEEYCAFQHKMRSLTVKVQANNNLHMLLYEKDQQFLKEKERNRHLESAFQLAQCHIARLAQRQLVSQGQPEVKRTSGSNNDDLETDGANPDINASTAVAEDEVELGEDQFGNPCVRSVPSEEPGRDLSAKSSTSAQIIPSTGQGLQGELITDIYNKNTSDQSGSEQKLINEVLDRPIPVVPIITGVSRTVFENVVQENLRIKKLLQEVLHRQNSDVATYFTELEYKDIVQQLRVDLANKENEIQRLESISLSGQEQDEESLQMTVSDLNQQVAKLTKHLNTKQTLLESIMTENEKYRDTYKKASLQSDMSQALQRITESKDKISSSAVSLDEPHQVQLKKMSEKHDRQIKAYKALLEKQEGKLARSKEQCQEYQSKLVEMRKSSVSSVSSIDHDEGYKVKIDILEDEGSHLKGELTLTRQKHLTEMKEQKHLYITQMNTYRKDYENEKAEKKAFEKKYQEEIKHMQWCMDRLYEDNERLSGLLDKARQNKKPAVSPQCIVPPIDHGEKPWKVGGTLQPVVVADGPASFINPSYGEKSKSPSQRPETEGMEIKGSHLGEGQGDKNHANRKKQTIKETFTCPRCERSFEESDKFEAHCKRCSDT